MLAQQILPSKSSLQPSDLYFLAIPRKDSMICSSFNIKIKSLHQVFLYKKKILQTGLGGGGNREGRPTDPLFTL